MDHLVSQKKKIKKLKKAAKRRDKKEKEERERLAVEEEIEKQQREKLKIDEFENMKRVKMENRKMNKRVETDEKQKLKDRNQKMIEELRKKEVFDLKDDTKKDELAKISFWVNEIEYTKKRNHSEFVDARNKEIRNININIDSEIKCIEADKKDQNGLKSIEFNKKTEQLDTVKPKKIQMICPGDNKHPIRLKHLTKLVLKSIGNGFGCQCCEKKLIYQKVCALQTCNHVLCRNCMKKLKKDGYCVCGVGFKKSDVLNLESAKSGFANGGNEVKVYTRAFMG